MMTEKELICISCPIGCHLKVVSGDTGEIIVTGNQCARGEIYGKEEFLAPRRIVTAVIKTGSLSFPYVPVKTDKPILKEYIPRLLKTLYSLEIELPVSSREIVLENFESTGVNVIITKSVKKND
ncbi:MAG: DUF1667 domain-containing protein [Spirochaetales bacterium]|nr:DUF1667 domain-containing protein [Spirochaetales bacterium]